MAGVFLSHTTSDKNFVYRVAADLVDQGIPVWLDAWEVDLGDNLHTKIYEGLDSSSHVLLFVSSKSIESAWVRKEIEAALAKEDQIGHKVLIPIILDRCKLPLSIAGRLFADLSSNYTAGLEKLTKELKLAGALDEDIPLAKRLIPLRFRRVTHLDDAALSANVKRLAKKHGSSFKIDRSQLVMIEEPECQALRDRMRLRLENIEEDPYFSEEFNRSFRQRYDDFNARQNSLYDGMTLLINGLANNPGSTIDLGKSAYWFSRECRSHLAYLLWSSQNPDVKPLIEWGKTESLIPTSDNHSAAEFYGVDSVGSFYVGPKESNLESHFFSWLPKSSRAYSEFEKHQRPMKVWDVCSFEEREKYLVPRMIASLLRDSGSPVTWDFADYLICHS
ncbi:MAG: toll/interleukin-1 receptor domain-containing protein [Sinimarinibacterium flocculans]|uniref:toll/interleukin-1 receptor domain-containing protein n=1 Tax=Sinimarinibacterium flocculans TaxID=985250 RepID=UPI003C360266